MLRNGLWILVCVGVTLTGCSRLTFIRPDASRGDYQQIAPTYDVSGGDDAKDGGSLNTNMQLTAAAELFRHGQLSEAERRVRSVLKDSPHSGNANTLMGLILGQGDQPEDAGAYYLAAIHANPNSGLYANNYGTWLCANGQPAQSLEWFDNALSDPTYRSPEGALLNAASCATKAGLSERAENSWRNILAHNPQSLPALAGMAGLMLEAGHFLDARAFAERWLAIAPEDTSGLRTAATIEQKLGDNAAATRYLSRLQAISHRSEQQVPRTQ